MANKPPFTSWSELNREDTSAWRKFISALVRSGLFPSGGGTGTITPGDTVQSQTSFGLSSTAGTSPDYSRKDHAHGTPADPGTGGGSGDARLVNDGRLERISDTSLQWVGYELGLYDVAAVAWIGRKPISLTLANTANDLDGNALTYDAQYDIYAEGTDGSTTTVALQAKKFSSGNTRTVTPELFEGRYVYDKDTDAGKRRLWLGTTRLRNDGGTAKFTDSSTQRLIFNWYNQKRTYIGKENPYNSDTHDTNVGTSWQAWRGNNDWKLEALLNTDTFVDLYCTCSISATASNSTSMCIGVDGTSPGTGSDAVDNYNVAGQGLAAHYKGTPGLGYHYFLPLVQASTTSNYPYYYYSSSGRLIKAAFQGEIWM